MTRSAPAAQALAAVHRRRPGRSIPGPGGINGDSYADFTVATSARTLPARIAVYFGGASGPSVTSITTITAPP